jgi:hypothetical protein
MKQNAGARNAEAIASLQKLMTDYNNDMELFKRTLQNSIDTGEKIEELQSEDVFRLVGDLYHLPINGPQIRERVKGKRVRQDKYSAKREHFVELPAKAISSRLMFHLKSILSAK